MSLLSLPPELRLLIYSHVDMLHWPEEGYNWTRHKPVPPPICRVCRVIRFETFPLYLQNNRFGIMLYYDESSSALRRSTRPQSHGQSSTSARRSGHGVYWTRPPHTKSEFFDHVGPDTLRDMIYLEIDYFWDCEESSREAISNCTGRTSRVSFQITPGKANIHPSCKHGRDAQEWWIYVEPQEAPRKTQKSFNFYLYEWRILHPALLASLDRLCLEGPISSPRDRDQRLKIGITRELIDTLLAMGNIAGAAPKRTKRVYEQKCGEKGTLAKEWRKRMRKDLAWKLHEVVNERHGLRTRRGRLIQALHK